MSAIRLPRLRPGPAGPRRASAHVAPAGRLRLPPRGSSARRTALGATVALLLVLLAAASVAGFVDGLRKQHAQDAVLHRTRDARRLAMAVDDGQAALAAFLLTSDAGFLPSCYAAMQTLRAPAPATLRMLDAASPSGAISLQLAALLALWARILASAGPDHAAALQLLARHAAGTDALRAGILVVVDRNLAGWDTAHAALDREQDALLIVHLLAAMLTACGLVLALRRGSAEATRRELAMAQALEAREQAIAGREEVRQVFAMAEALQSADGLKDGAAILRASAARMLPHLAGALYVFNTARDRLDLVAAWDPARSDLQDGPPPQPAEFLLPHECWALKRSKPHLNGSGPAALRCCHAGCEGASLEVPMVGRGEPVGLLVLATTGPDAVLEAVRERACVLADSMSLALSSILLCEKLRNQAVRDGLTGLYNRRFLEEVMHNLLSQSARRHAALSAIMIDLDHFKQLNDTHGHATGDAVLKAAAAALRGMLRGTDIACRYGGEELIVLMPDCTLDIARAKADQIRDSIASLARHGSPRVTASLGVASFPACARDADELLAAADQALYRSKQTGRNRVTAAPSLPSAALLRAHGMDDRPTHEADATHRAGVVALPC